MTQHRRIIRAFCAGLVLIAAGCAGSQAVNTTPTPESSAIRLSVKNGFGYPVTVYAIGSGTTWKVGRVMPEATRDFTVPQALVANGVVEFAVSGDGDAAPVRSGPMQLTSGQIVDFTITRPLYASSAVVRR